MVSRKNRTWKDALLSSGLPLEYLVAEKLGQNKFHIAGEYSYTRQNEQDINTEFSVDLLAMQSMGDLQGDRWGNLHLLLECEYRRCGTRWIFSPHPSPTRHNMDLVTLNQDLCTRRITHRYLSRIYPKVQHCLRGTEFHNTSKKANPNEISHGLSQLYYATPNLVLQSLSHQINATREEDLYIQIICPILVTTATLYILKPDLDLANFYSALDLTEVAEETDALIVDQRPGPQLQKYSENLLGDFLRENRTIESYMKELGDILINKGVPKDIISSMVNLRSTILSSSKLVLVVNYDAFDQRLNDLWDLICASAKTLERYTTLKKETVQNGLGSHYEVFFTDQTIDD